MQAEEIFFSDKKSFEALFKQYYERLCKYANNWLNDWHASEEVVQQVFYKLWDKKHQINIESSIKPYLYKAVYYGSLNELKRIEKQNSIEAMKSEELEKASHSETPYWRELQDRIEEGLNKLPEQCRIIFKMSRYEDLKYREIAEVLNISVKTVENQMGKALKLMRQNLSEYLTILFIFLIK